MNPTPWSTAVLGELRAALLDHYHRYGRAFPWRGESDPYRILVSEVMLQQTRVETVALRYGPWLDRFPDLESLAMATEDLVLKAWEGLGYYRRALNLHRTATLVRERPNASLPSTYTELRELPGCGDYTAGAVASIAFGEPVAAVDGNVRRVLARLLDEPDPTPAWARSAAATLLDSSRPGDWNQAMMDLGATVCTPRSPRCEACALARWCAARAAGTQSRRPRRYKKRPPRTATIAVAVLHTDRRILLERRPARGLLGGLWSFPEREVSDASGARAAVVELARERGLGAEHDAVSLPTCEHAFTHLRATYVPMALEVDALPGISARESPDVAWIEAHRPTELALPVAQQRVLASFLQEGLSSPRRWRLDAGR